MIQVLEVRVDNIPVAYVLGKDNRPLPWEKPVRHCRDNQFLLQQRADTINMVDNSARTTYHPV